MLIALMFVLILVDSCFVAMVAEQQKQKKSSSCDLLFCVSRMQRNDTEKDKRWRELQEQTLCEAVCHHKQTQWCRTHEMRNIRFVIQDWLTFVQIVTTAADLIASQFPMTEHWDLACQQSALDCGGNWTNTHNFHTNRSKLCWNSQQKLFHGLGDVWHEWSHKDSKSMHQQAGHHFWIVACHCFNVLVVAHELLVMFSLKGHTHLHLWTHTF